MHSNVLWLVAVLIYAAPQAFAADRETAVKALEQACEVARETRLKPLRDAEIAKCKADGRGEPGFCERHFRDFGAAFKRPNGSWQARMFDDLPECVAAYKARRDFNVNGT